MESTKIKKMIFLIFNLFSFLFQSLDFLSFRYKTQYPAIQQYNSLKPNIPIALCFIFFFASLSLSLSLSHILSHTHTKAKIPIFSITVAEHGGARGDIGGFMRGFDIRCPRGTVDTKYATVDDARRRSGSHPFR